MAMLSVFCNDCGGMFSLRGWIDREDLKNTLYESVMNTISDEQLTELHNNGSIKNEWENLRIIPYARSADRKMLYGYERGYG